VQKNCSAFDCYFYFDCYFTEVKISLNDRAEVFSRYFLLMQTSERTKRRIHYYCDTFLSRWCRCGPTKKIAFFEISISFLRYTWMIFCFGFFLLVILSEIRLVFQANNLRRKLLSHLKQLVQYNLQEVFQLNETFENYNNKSRFEEQIYVI
jgi:hypothetical protein